MVAIRIILIFIVQKGESMNLKRVLAILIGLTFFLLTGCIPPIDPIPMKFVDVPIFLPAGGIKNSDQIVTLSCSTSGATIHYTTDGTDPSSISSVYSSGINVAGDGTILTIKAIAMKNGMSDSSIASASYTINYDAVDEPIFLPASGIKNSDQVVTLSCSTSGATIHYTTDGTDPSSISSVYSSGINVAGDGTILTIKAIAVKNGMSDSSITSASYTINYNAVDEPILFPASGIKNSDQVVTLSCSTSGATIHYTIDGTDPSSISSVYSSGINVAGDGTILTIKAIAVKNGMSDSSISSASYTIDYDAVDEPILFPAGGIKNSDQVVTLSCATSGATIHYTTDGTNPSSISSIYSSGINVAGDGTILTIKAIAVKNGMSDSSITSASYTINYDAVDEPILFPAGGIKNSDQVVTLSCATSGATIHYTIDGTNPSSISSVYSSGINVAGDGTILTIKAIAVKNGMSDSSITSISYTINYDAVDEPIFLPAGGIKDSDQVVTLSCSTSGATIHYTTDGTDPSSLSSVYSSGINVVGDGTVLTIKAIAIKNGMRPSPIAFSIYAIRYVPHAFSVQSPVSGNIGSVINNISVDSSGNIYIVGFANGMGTLSFGNGVSISNSTDSLVGIIVKYNSTGQAVWALVGSSGYSGIYTNILGDVYVVGSQLGNSTYSYGNGITLTGSSPSSNFVLIKYSSNGIPLWARTSSSGTTDTGYGDVLVDDSGNIYVVGWVGNGNIDFGNGVSGSGVSMSGNAVLVKYDSSGIAQWAKFPISEITSGGYAGSSFNGIGIDNANSIYVVGTQQSNAICSYGNGVTASGISGGNNGVLVKYDTLGTAIWSATAYSGYEESNFAKVVVDASNNIFVAGSQNGTTTNSYGSSASCLGSSSNSNSLLIKYSQDGYAQWAQSTYNSPTAGSSLYLDVSIDCESGLIYTAGYLYGKGTFNFSNSTTVENKINGQSALILQYGTDGKPLWGTSVLDGSLESAYVTIANGEYGSIFIGGMQVGIGTNNYGIGVNANTVVDHTNALLIEYIQP